MLAIPPSRCERIGRWFPPVTSAGDQETVNKINAGPFGLSTLDLFSAAAGGWSLGMGRAGFHTVAACESVAWRRALYAENNPGVPIYDNVLTLTAARLQSDLGALPDVIVGSAPCQDISSANTKGKGVDGARSGLVFEAVRIIGECRPRWFALENSALVRVRGYDRVAARLEALGYTCEPFVVGADDLGAPHERKRSWIVGFDAAQVTDAARLGHEGRRAWGRGPDGDGASPADKASITPCCDDRGDVGGPWPEWNGGLAAGLRLANGLSARASDTRVAVGGARGTSGAALLVEAYGDAVIPQIPEAIGRAILRTERALATLLGAA
jgi:DNA (cytosine-5)-methyltransferase 1